MRGAKDNPEPNPTQPGGRGGKGEDPNARRHKAIGERGSRTASRRPLPDQQAGGRVNHKPKRTPYTPLSTFSPPDFESGR